MPDYISTSQKISLWLKEQGITFEVDAFAPVVVRQFGRLEVIVKWSTEVEIICPFFGPGGSDNSLKALTTYIEKKENQWRLDFVQDGYVIGWRLYSEESPEIYVAKGTAHGIALCALLKNLMEAK